MCVEDGKNFRETRDSPEPLSLPLNASVFGKEVEGRMLNVT